MRRVFLISCAGLLAGCFAARELEIGELPAEAGEEPAPLSPIDASAGDMANEDATLTQDLDAQQPTDSAASAPFSERDATRAEDAEDDDTPRDAGQNLLDAGRDAALAPDAGADAGDASAQDAALDAAPRNWICDFEPWHCL